MTSPSVPQTLTKEDRDALRVSFESVLAFARRECYSDELPIADEAEAYVRGLEVEVSRLKAEREALVEALQAGTIRRGSDGLWVAHPEPDVAADHATLFGEGVMTTGRPACLSLNPFAALSYLNELRASRSPDSPET